MRFSSVSNLATLLYFRSMNRFVAHRSRFYLVIAWAFAATLFADAANLDDLFASNYVVHDDDAASAPPGTIPVPDCTPHPGGTKAPAQPLHLILDQDSPSLAAEYDGVALISTTDFASEEILPPRAFRDDGLLHIKLHTLLI